MSDPRDLAGAGRPEEPSSARDIGKEEVLRAGANESEGWACAALDALSAHIAVLDERGVIRWVNRAWREFARANFSRPDRVGEEVNYLEVCDAAAGEWAVEAAPAAAAIRALLRGEGEEYRCEYPCHSPEARRWFRMSATRFPSGGGLRVVVAHEDITERRLAEDARRESLDELSAIYEHAPLVLLLLDEERRVVKANAAALAACGRRTDEAAGLRGGEMLRCIRALDDTRGCGFGPTCGSCTIRSCVLDSLATGQAHRQEDARLHFDRGDGTREMAVLVSTAPLRLEGRRLVLVCLEDVTERQRSEAALREHARQLEAVREVAEEIVRELDLSVLLRLICCGVSRLLGGVSGALHLWDEAAQRLVPHAWDDPGGWRQTFSLRPGEGVAGAVALRREGLLVNDFRASSYATPFHLRHTRHTAVLAEPLLYRERLLGVIAVENERIGRPFTVEDQQVLRLFAGQAAVAIENARLYAAAQRELRERELAEEALRGSETRFRQLFEEMSSGLALHEMLFDAQGVPCDYRFLEVNEAFEHITGLRRESVVGRRVLEILPDLDPFWVRTYGRVVSTGQPERFERYEATLGRWFEVRAYVPAPGRFAAIFSDISERKAAEEALAARTRQLEALRAVGTEITRELDLTRLLDLLLDRVGGLIATQSGTIFRWDEAEQVLAPWHSRGLGAWFQEVRQRLGEGVVGAAAERRSGLIVNDYRSSVYTLPIILERTTIATAMAQPLLYRERLVGVIVLRDRTDGARFSQEDLDLLGLFASQAAIAIENARLYSESLRRTRQIAALQRATGAVMAGLDLKETLNTIIDEASKIAACPAVKILLVDRAAGVFRLSGAREASMPEGYILPLGRGLSGLVERSGRPVYSSDVQADPRSTPELRRFDRRMGRRTFLGLPVREGEEILGVLTLNTHDPRVYSAEEIAYLMVFADQAALAIKNARLFEAQKETMRQLQQAQAELVRAEKLRALGQMSAGIAHDLNNMLAAVLGQVELMRHRRTEDSALRESLDCLETAATDGAAMVRRLQTFARQETQASLAPCDLAALVREAVELTRPRWEEESRRCGIVVSLTAVLPELPLVLGNGPEIREVLTNLILNAVDAMPEGGSLSLQGWPVEPPGDQPGGDAAGGADARAASWVELAVADTGVGMTEEVRQRAFDPFFTTKGAGGTGLGLSVVYSIMERHGGQVEVVSVPGEGTTFRLRFRRARTGEPIGPPAPEMETGPPRRILVIDDEEPVRRTLVRLLRSVGHTVLEAPDGPSGLSQLEAAAVDCVLTDLSMRGMSGYEVGRVVKARRPGLPVILLTGWLDPAAPDSEPLGVDRTLGKPVRIQELLAMVAELTAEQSEPSR